MHLPKYSNCIGNPYLATFFFILKSKTLVSWDVKLSALERFTHVKFNPLNASVAPM